ncbi:MAG: serine/threonine-protein kinase, partial [Myxococcota bacterium]|nr:serine/threonine-protein kinase [Myxococcota bacterium]
MANRLGKYHLVRKIAQGGMAEVFLARQEGPAGFEKEVVVKRILPERASDPQFVEMFLTEARVAAAMAHPNIVQIFELGEHDGTYFIAMEAVRGVAVSQLITRMAQFDLRVPPRFAARIISDVCAGLAYAHGFRVSPEQRGVLHRDVSPDNVLVSYNGAVKIIDFGVARALDDGSAIEPNALLGKMRYMPPERAEGGTVDARSDLFGLAIVLYELLTGAHPFGDAGGLAAAAANAHNTLRPARELVPDLSSTMTRILDRGLQRDPDARFPTADAMRKKLEAFLSSEGGYLGDTELGEFVSSVVRGGDDDLVWLKSLADVDGEHPGDAVRDAGKLGGVGVASGHLASSTMGGPKSVTRAGQPRPGRARRLWALSLLLLALVGVAVWSGYRSGADVTRSSSSPPPWPVKQTAPTPPAPPTPPVAPPPRASSPAPATETTTAAPIRADATAPGVVTPSPDADESVGAAPAHDVETAPSLEHHDAAAPSPPPAAPVVEAVARPQPSVVPKPSSTATRAQARPLVGASMRGMGRVNVTSNVPGARVTI